VHFGSRGFGHLTASGFLALAQGLAWDDRAQGGEMNSPPVLLRTDSALGHMYIEAMQLAGEYAYAGRDLVCDEVLDILGAEPMAQVHNHHNFAWLENTPYGKAWVVRKGATPLWPGQRGFVGGSMGENAVIIEGIEAPLAQEALYSAPHGAGRAMSRTEAAGKKRKRTYCRNCGWTQQPGQPRPTDDRCPSCKRYGDLNKKWVTERPGKVDWAGTQKALAFAGIHLRGGGADEAPMAYKRLPDVLAAHAGHIKILHELRPIGVAMAGADIRDPYKD
jgi:tRNA-splicing ligase RtcB